MLTIKESATVPGTWEVNGWPLFESGTHKGRTYTDADLDNMVAANEQIGNKIKPFLKLGHDNGQGLLQEDGYPSAGLLTRLYRTGTVLMADVKNIPRRIADLIQKRAYGRMSAEIAHYFKDDSGIVFPHVLKAVALLGGDTPAVKTLDDFWALYGEHREAAAFIEDRFNGAKIDVVEFAVNGMTRTQCMEAMAGKVDDPGAFCQWAETNQKGPFAGESSR